MVAWGESKTGGDKVVERTARCHICSYPASVAGWFQNPSVDHASFVERNPVHAVHSFPTIFQQNLYLKRTMFLILLMKFPNRVLSGASASSLSKSV